MAVSVASFNQVADWFVSTTPRTITGLSWTSGDVVVVVGGAETASTSVATPTNANLTFALQASETSGGSGEAAIWVWIAVAGSSQSSQTIQATATGGQWWGFAVWVSSGASGSVANATADLTDSAFTFTPTVDSLVIYGHMDWNATSGKTITAGTGTPTERFDANGSNYGVYLGDWVNVAASSASFGISSYAGVQIARARIEVLATGGAVTAEANLTVTVGLTSDATLPAPPSGTLTFLRPLTTPRTI